MSSRKERLSRESGKPIEQDKYLSLSLSVSSSRQDIDENDFPFVATAIFLDGYLWTGDKKLYQGLKAKNFNAVYDAADIKKLVNYE